MKPIQTPEEWIARSVEARDRLIADHGVRLADFHVVQSGDDLTLGWSTIYPEAWANSLRATKPGT